MKNFKNLLSMIIGVVLAFVMGAVFAFAVKAPDLSFTFGAVLAALSLIPKTAEIVAFDTVSPDLSAIMKYAVAQGVTLLKKYYGSFDIANDITLRTKVKNSQPLPMLVINGEPRPYDGIFDPISGIAYTDRELTVEKFQRDIRINPGFYKDTYLAYYRGLGENAKNMAIPYAEFTINAYLQQNAAKLNRVTAFNGLGKAAFTDFNPASAYAIGDRIKWANSSNVTHYYTALAVTTAGQTPATHAAKWKLSDALAIAIGLGTKLKTARTDAVITNIASTGAITITDAFDQALSVYRALPEEVREDADDVYLYASTNVWDKISDSFKDGIKKYTDADGNLMVLPRTEGKCKVKRASWMSGSELMIASPKSNLYMGTDLTSDMNIIKPVEQVYHIDMGLTGVIGFEFGDEQAIAMNDQN